MATIRLFEAEGVAATIGRTSVRDKVAGSESTVPSVHARVQLSRNLSVEDFDTVPGGARLREMVQDNRSRVGGDGFNVDEWKLKRPFGAHRVVLRGEDGVPVELSPATVAGDSVVYRVVEGVAALLWTLEAVVTGEQLSQLGLLCDCEVSLDTAFLQADLLDGDPEEKSPAVRKRKGKGSEPAGTLDL